MIDLLRGRDDLLAEIGASEEAFANRVDDPSDPAFLDREQASVVIRDRWSEILPRLRPPLVRRFADVPPEQFIRDIGRPLKMGLGNADKRGNLGDPQKRITVEVVVTPAGGVISISDEGRGFDVAGTLRGLHNEENYFTHRGGGFKAFERAASLITFADGGSTLLIRFLRGGDLPTPGLAIQDDWMKHVLRKLPMIAKRGGTLESCRIHLLEKNRPHQPEIRYVLEVRDAAAELERTILTGRLLSEPAAMREYSVAKQLYKGSFKSSDGLRVPKPMQVFKLHPRLVFYRFEPGMDLREYLESSTDSERMTKVVKEVAVGLRALHRSGVSVDIGDDTVEGIDSNDHRRGDVGDSKTTGDSAQTISRALAAAMPDRLPRARRFFGELERLGAGVDGLSEQVPTHGSFGLDCVRRGPDRFGTDRFYIYRFDECRIAHPAVDVGGFLADLSGLGGEPTTTSELRRRVRHLFLESYLAEESPAWLDHLPFFVATAHVARLERAIHFPQVVAGDVIDALLAQGERSLVGSQ